MRTSIAAILLVSTLGSSALAQTTTTGSPASSSKSAISVDEVLSPIFASPLDTRYAVTVN